jgi:hypothetical protein
VSQYAWIVPFAILLFLVPALTSNRREGSWTIKSKPIAFLVYYVALALCGIALLLSWPGC